jgi:hypothetical protein
VNQTNIKPITNPWPGPKPYEIWDGGYFFGREMEVAEIRRMVLRERLTILSAESGAGKTSLLRAGLVYNLMRDRGRAVEHELASPAKPVLILSDWAGGKGQDVNSLFLNSLERALSRFKETAIELTKVINLPAFQESQKQTFERLIQNILSDHAALSAQPAPVEEELTFFNQVTSLCSVFGGVIFIFDQFEEVLRAGSRIKNEALEIIKEIYRFEPRARLLISLRREYHTELHTLETYVGGLYTRTYFLLPMRAKTVREAIRNSAKAAGIGVADEVVDQIIQMLVEARQQAVETDETIESVEDYESDLDLLTLQSILKELFDTAHEKQKDLMQIDRELFDLYINGRSLSEVVGEALERWIKRSLLRPSDKFATLVSAEILDLDSKKLHGIIRRIATRMAPFLSSGGYKVPAEENDLLFQALRLDLSRLRPGLESNPGDWKIIGMEPPQFDRNFLGLADTYDKSTETNISGLAREKKWSPATTADHLLGLFFETLYRLKGDNVIKSVRVGKGQVWELVHDRLGKPLSNWAETQRDTWDDCVNSLTSCKGIDISVGHEFTTEFSLSNLNWRGCVITPREEIVFENIEFINSDLSGTYFSNCIFRGGKFDYCDLSGVIFLNCHFECGPDGKPFRFINNFADGLTIFSPESEEDSRFKSEMGHVTFEKCLLNHLRIARVCLTGDLDIKDETGLYLSEFIKLTPEDGKRPRLSFGEDCSINYCTWDKQTQRIIDFYANQTGCGMVSDNAKH